MLRSSKIASHFKGYSLLSLACHGALLLDGNLLKLQRRPLRAPEGDGIEDLKAALPGTTSKKILANFFCSAKWRYQFFYALRILATINDWLQGTQFRAIGILVGNQVGDVRK